MADFRCTRVTVAKRRARSGPESRRPQPLTTLRVVPDAANRYAFASANGADTDGWFEYGATPSLTDDTATATESLGAGSTRPVSSRTSLPMGSPFYFRAVVRNWLGIVRHVVYEVTSDACVT